MRVLSSFCRLTAYLRELEELKSRDNFSMKEIRVETMKRNVEVLDKLTVNLQAAKTELQVSASAGSLYFRDIILKCSIQWVSALISFP